MKIFASDVGLAFLISFFFATGAVSAPAAEVGSDVDWQKFLAREDLVWDTMPTNWESGAFIGNGLLGAMIYAGETNRLQWDVGRSDVTDHGDRIPIGRFVLVPGSAVSGGTMRLDLWNAEARGDLKTANSEIKWRSFTHARDLVSVIEYWEPTFATNEPFPKIEFQHLSANPARLEYQRTPIPGDEMPSEPTYGEETNGIFGRPIHWCLQPLNGGGAYLVAWVHDGLIDNHQLLFFTVNFQKSGSAENPSMLVAETVAQFKSTLLQNSGAYFYERFIPSHRAWWHEYYPESFLSIPDAWMESFYWIQMYKLASATRADRPAIDLMGPWFRRTPWPHIWWNLNIELTYWPVYTANRLELGESFIRLIDNDFTNFINNVPEQWRYDSAGVGRSSPYDGKRAVPGMTGSGVMERGDLTWALHNYWLQYRYSGDETLLRDGLYPKLKRAIAYYLHLLTPGPDGKLHLPLSTSPEYPSPTGRGNALVHDANYDLSLLRWGLNTLLAIDERFNLDDPLTEKWRDTLKNLTPNPVDENGYRVGADQPFAVSHRHFSHLFAIYPLHLVDPQSATDRPLIEKSLDHWASMRKAWRGYSFTGASAMSSWLERKDDAVKYLNEFLDRPKTVLPNTMYVEAGPVIETPLSCAASIHEIVLQSWSMEPFGTHLRVFPAVPDSWKDVVFYHLRAEGDFLVSAVRHDGRTQFVEITSLAGAPCRVSTSLEGKIIASGNRDFKVTTETDRDGHPITVIDLKKGETVLLTSADEKLSAEDLSIKPVTVQSGIPNFYGSPKTNR